MAKVLASAALAVAGVAGLLLGPAALAVAVVVTAALVLLDGNSLLVRGGNRPVLLVAVLLGVGLPVLAARDPLRAWERIPPMFAAGFVLAFALLLVFGRRSEIAPGLGATMFLALLVGLGTASVLLLRALPLGFRWVLGFVAVTAAADLAPAARRRLRQRHAAVGRHGDALSGSGSDVLAAAVLATVAVAAVAAFALQPPFSAGTAAVVALVALTAAFGGEFLHHVLAAEAGIPADGDVRVGEGLVLAVADAVLLAAPPVYVVARSVSG